MLIKINHPPSLIENNISVFINLNWTIQVQPWGRDQECETETRTQAELSTRTARRKEKDDNSTTRRPRPFWLSNCRKNFHKETSFHPKHVCKASKVEWWQRASRVGKRRETWQKEETCDQLDREEGPPCKIKVGQRMVGGEGSPLGWARCSPTSYRELVVHPGGGGAWSGDREGNTFLPKVHKEKEKGRENWQRIERKKAGKLERNVQPGRKSAGWGFRTTWL